MGSFKLGKMTFGSLFKKPETLLYPFQTKTPPKGLKGIVALDADKCGLCGICVKRCPCNSIVIDKKARTWSINHYSCVQCGSCVRECTKDCLYMLPNAPCVTPKFVPEVVFVPEKPKTAKKSAASGTGVGAAPAQAGGIASAHATSASNTEKSEIIIEPTGDADMDAKLAAMPAEKALKVRAAFMAKLAKEAT